MFTIDVLNHEIQTFPLSQADRRSKPAILKPLNGKILTRLPGKGMSTFVLLKILPSLLQCHVEEEDEILDAVVYMHSLQELLMSEKFNADLIAELECAIRSYFNKRSEMSNVFRRIKPKHHNISHYHHFIEFYGPPINVWTARHESKH